MSPYGDCKQSPIGQCNPRPDWVPRPAVRASDRPGGGAGGGAPQPRPAPRGSGTSSGSSRDKHLHRAGLHRPLSGFDLQNEACADEQGPDRARFSARRALKVAAILPPEVGREAQRVADERWPATPPAPRRRPWSGHCTGAKRQPQPSRFAAAGGRLIHLVQQGCNFFWMAIIASACSRRRRNAAFSRLALVRSACRGLIGAFSGPRRRGCSAPNAPPMRLLLADHASRSEPRNTDLPDVEWLKCRPYPPRGPFHPESAAYMSP